jgi:hypothetical protein
MFVRFENDKIAKLADIESGIGFSCSGEGRSAIPNRALQHPMHSGFNMTAGPHPVDFTLFGFPRG